MKDILYNVYTLVDFNILNLKEAVALQKPQPWKHSWALDNGCFMFAEPFLIVKPVTRVLKVMHHFRTSNFRLLLL